MTTAQLHRVNALLRDRLGSNPRGEPMFKWVHSRDRELFYPLENGQGNYEMAPQVYEDRWVLAKWLAPPSRMEWESVFRGQIPYPRRGYYHAVDTACDWLLKRGIEPNERITNYLSDIARDQLAMSRKQIMAHFADSRAYRAKEKERIIEDCVGDACTACSGQSIPGKRGGSVSFPGVQTTL